MKIVHVFWSFTIGGAENMLVDLMNLQVKENEVYLLIINNLFDDDLLKSLNNKIRIIKLNRKPGQFNPLPYLKLYWFLLKTKPDITHCHNTSLDKIILYKNSKLVLTVHSMGNKIRKNNNYSRIVAISKAVQNDLINTGIGNTSIIYNGIRAHDITPKLGFNKNLELICVGRLEHEIKGQDILLKAFAQLVKEDLALRLTFVGRGSSKNYLEDLVLSLNLKNKVRFIVLGRENLYKEINNYDIAIVPSLSEGFGLSAIEFMSAKVPIIISNAEGLMEVTNGGKFAEVSPMGSIDHLSDSLRLLINKIKCSELDINERLNLASSYVKRNFTINKMFDNYMKLYKDVII
ncbi:MAG: glycosyltransferase [Melioribacteraceae bacterium]|nr:glycosyltransferase [Melioribacteraceae bacterium]